MKLHRSAAALTAVLTADAGLSDFADASFRAMDTNKDGKISEDEYHAAVGQGTKAAR